MKVNAKSQEAVQSQEQQRTPRELSKVRSATQNTQVNSGKGQMLKVTCETLQAGQADSNLLIGLKPVQTHPASAVQWL